MAEPRGAEAQLAAQVERLTRQQVALVALAASDVQRQADLARSLQEITEVAATTLGVERAGVWFLERDGSELRCADMFLASRRSHVRGEVLAATDYPRYFEALATGRAVDAHEALRDERTRELADAYLARHGIASMLDAAIRREGRVIGVVCHEHVGPARAWAPDETSFAGDVADQVALALAASERRRGMEVLRQSEERFRTLARHAPVGIFQTDPTGQGLFVNERIAVLTGVSPDETLGMGWVKTIHPDDRPRVVGEWSDAVSRGEGYDSTFRLLRPDGGVRWVRARGSALRGVGDSFEGHVGTLEDITRMKEDVADRERLLAELRAALGVRDEFLSLASHELRTPLTSLQLAAQASLELLRTDPSRPLSSVDLYLRMVERQSRRLSSLIDNLLDVSRMEAGRFELHVAEMDLAALVREVADGFAEEAAHARSDLVVDAPAAVVGPWDASRLEQVVTNLIGNALKFGSGCPVRAGVGLDGDHAVLTVTDGGPGIATALASSLFQRFAAREPPREHGGLGLGLYIVRRIVEEHRGTVEVSSPPGQGATFTVRLPRTAPPRAGAAPPAEAAPPAPAG